MRIGIDIGGTKTDAVSVTGPSGVLHRVRRPTTIGAAAVVDQLQGIVEELVAAAQVDLSEVDQIGIGIPGVVEVTTGRVRHAVNLGIVDLELATELRRRLGVPVVVENDVNAAALGAWHHLESTGSMAYLNLGTGLAAGLVVDGAVWRGARGGAGEIGHIPVDPTGIACPCGQRGCLETIASGSGIARAWPSTARLPAVELFDHADRGEHRATEVRSTFLRGVASAVRILVLSADCEVVVIGGGLGNLGVRLVEPLQEVFRDWSRDSPFIDSLRLTSRVQLLPQGLPVAAIGAAMLTAQLEPASV